MIKFIITGPTRSGSHMLITALEQHPEIHCLREIFLPTYFEQSYIPEGKLTVRDVLDDLSWPQDKQIFGFSVLYNELFQSRYTRGLIDELAERGFRIIHLTRANLLRRFLSNKIACSSKIWTDTEGRNLSTLKLKLSCRELLFDINRTLSRAEKIRSLLGHLPLLEICYEDLCADFYRSFARVCEFLGASVQDLKPQTYKQETRPLREAITNYNQLKLFFVFSKHRRCFDE